MMPNEIPDPKPGFKSHHPELIKHSSGYNLSIRRYTADCLVGTHIEEIPIECCVSMIDWLIQNRHFNKEYLKEQSNGKKQVEHTMLGLPEISEVHLDYLIKSL